MRGERLGSSLLILLLLLLGAAGCTDAPATQAALEFPKLTGHVVDQADLLTPVEERALEAHAMDLEREGGPQLVIVTLSDLKGSSIEQYGLGLGRYWGVGSKERNDGILLIVAPNERKVRIEVGSGLEKRVPDQFADEVIREAIMPRFRQGRYPEGIEAAASAIVQRLRSGEVADHGGLKEAA